MDFRQFQPCEIWRNENYFVTLYQQSFGTEKTENTEKNTASTPTTHPHHSTRLSCVPSVASAILRDVKRPLHQAMQMKERSTLNRPLKHIPFAPPLVYIRHRERCINRPTGEKALFENVSYEIALFEMMLPKWNQ